MGYQQSYKLNELIEQLRLKIFEEKSSSSTDNDSETKSSRGGWRDAQIQFYQAKNRRNEK